MDKSFAKYTPTVFIITSPFQLLCSLEALAEFEIGKSNAEGFVSCLRKELENVLLEFTLRSNAGQQGCTKHYDCPKERFMLAEKII